MHRRRFLLAGPAAALALPRVSANPSGAAAAPDRRPRLSCNLYSFNRPLRSGELSLEDAITYCADLGFDAVDPTGYYLGAYPAVPSDERLFQLKRLCVDLGLDISGTGVRNDFTLKEPAARAGDVALVQAWIDGAVRLGAPQLRVFAGHALPTDVAREEMEQWVVDHLRQCCAYGASRGVLVSVQNHAAYLKTADDVLRLRELVDSDWFGLVLDIGSFRGVDTYAAIERLAPLATTWQIKENVWVDGREVKTDLVRLFGIIQASGYRGYLPLETLGPGDARAKIARFLDEVREAWNRA